MSRLVNVGDAFIKRTSKNKKKDKMTVVKAMGKGLYTLVNAKLTEFSYAATTLQGGAFRKLEVKNV